MSPPRFAPTASEAPVQGGGTYRTVCVRLCDGFFFPVSSQTTRRGFYRDAGLCRSKCGEEGRLFFAPAPGIEVGQMRDLTGRSYPALGNAFLYRKRYVPSCRCRPEPWSAAEITRHARYAAAGDAERPRQPLVGLVVSGRPSAVVASGVVEAEVPPAKAPALEIAQIKTPPDSSLAPAPTPGLTTGGVATGDAAAPPIPNVPEVAAKPVRVARKPAREKDKVRQAAARKAHPAAALPRQAPARQPAVAAPRQVWPGDRPG